MARPRDAQAFLSSLEPLECSICFEGYDPSHPPVILECRHIFGETCLREWIGRDKSKCPYCNASLFGEESASPRSEQVQQRPAEVLTTALGELSIAPSAHSVRQSPATTREGSIARWTQGVQQPPAEVLSTALGEISVTSSTRGARPLPNITQEANVARWLQQIQQPSVDVMSVMSSGLAWDRRVNRRMKRLVSKSARIVAALLQLPGQTKAVVDLIRMNSASQHPPRNRLQRNPEFHPQARESLGTAAEERHARNGRDGIRQLTHRPTSFNNPPRQTNEQDSHGVLGYLRNVRDEADVSGRRARQKDQEDQDRAYAQLLQRLYYERHHAYEVYDRSDYAPAPRHARQHRGYDTYESPSHARRAPRFRNAALNGLYDGSNPTIRSNFVLGPFH